MDVLTIALIAILSVSFLALVIVLVYQNVQAKKIRAQKQLESLLNG